MRLGLLTSSNPLFNGLTQIFQLKKICQTVGYLGHVITT